MQNIKWKITKYCLLAFISVWTVNKLAQIIPHSEYVIISEIKQIHLPVKIVEAKTKPKAKDVIDYTYSKEYVKELVANSKHPDILTKLVTCESQYTSIKRIDSNGYYSYGILQYQSSTWNMWSKQSGIKGNPMNPNDAVHMADWALDKGLLYHWSCAKITGLLK